MIADYIKRGLASGIAGGTVFALYLFFIVSPYIEAIEAIHTESHHSSADAILTVSSFIDIGSSILWGMLLGLIFAAFYYIFEVSIPGSKIHKPFLLAGAGFMAISGLPWLLLPPSLEPVVQRLSQTTRTVMYIVSIGSGAFTAGATMYVYRRIS